jgi:hypothetical protein
MVATLFGGLYPAKSIADARIWARDLNEQIEAGIDPRAAQREAKAVAQMTVGYAHSLYIAAAGDGRTSNKKESQSRVRSSIRLEFINVTSILN